MLKFEKSFTQQEPISDAAIARAVSVLQSGRLHRYNVADDEDSEAALLEKEFAAYQEVPYCVACASGGYALHIALRSAGLEAGESVLSNAYTLAPVPGAIHNAGGRPVLVETDENYHIDIDDLYRKARSSRARFLLLSHMRGHIADMEKVVDLCNELEILLIEDCAHTMGARWKGAKSGNFGTIACFSTQTYKHLNSGEGGLLTTADPTIAARAVVHSGSYMLYERNGAIPTGEYFEQIKLFTPNYSGRMDNLRAAILRAQLPELDRNCGRWNERYRKLEQGLRAIPEVRIPTREPHEEYVGSSIQFSIPRLESDRFPEFLQQCANRGLDLKWFGEDQPRGFTSRYDSWRYLDDPTELSQTLTVLAKTCDMRVPLTFDLEDCKLITDILSEAVGEVL